MKISEVVEKLLELKVEHGDIDVLYCPEWDIAHIEYLSYTDPHGVLVEYVEIE